MKNWNWKKIGSNALQIALFFVAVWGILTWQTRNLLKNREQAPDFTLTAVDGSVHSLSEARGKKVVLYFIAPWCSICKTSFPTLNTLRKSKSADELVIYAIALSYEDPSEVREFLRERPATFPVLLGTPAVHSAYQVQAFPTMYVLDEEGRVESKLIGLSTKMQLAFKSLF